MSGSSACVCVCVCVCPRRGNIMALEVNDQPGADSDSMGQPGLCMFCVRMSTQASTHARAHTYTPTHTKDKFAMLTGRFQKLSGM